MSTRSDDRLAEIAVREVDAEGLRREIALVKPLGYNGQSLVNPRQIEVVHDVFAPKAEEVAYALEVLEVIQRARQMGTAVRSARAAAAEAVPRGTP